MPANYDDDDDFDGNGPKALRDALKKAQDELKARDKELDALRLSNDTLSKQVKTTTLRDALTDAGVDPKYARFAERDEVEATPESVKKWVEDNTDVYAFLAAKQAAPTEGATEQVEQADEQGDELEPEFVNQILKAQRVESSGRPSGTTSIADALAGVDVSKIKNEAELLAIFDGLGAPRPGE